MKKRIEARTVKYIDFAALSATVIALAISEPSLGQEVNESNSAPGFAVPDHSKNDSSVGTDTGKSGRRGLEGREIPQVDETATRQALGADLRRELARLEIVSHRAIEFEGGQTTSMVGSNIGVLDKKSIASNLGGPEPSLAAVVHSSEVLFKSHPLAVFEVTRVEEGYRSTYVRFHQVVGDIALPESTLQLDESGNIVSMQVTSVDPTLPIFDKSKWMAKEAINAALKNYSQANEGGIDFSHVTELGFRAVFHPVEDRLTIVYEFEFGSKIYRIDALNGEIHSTSELMSTARQACNRIAGKPMYLSSPNGYRGCDYPSNLEVFDINSACVDNSVFCGDATRDDAIAEVFGAYFYSSSWLVDPQVTIWFSMYLHPGRAMTI